MYAVIYGNYFPREVDSYWHRKEDAEAQANQLNDEMRLAGLGAGMWEVELLVAQDARDAEHANGSTGPS